MDSQTDQLLEQTLVLRCQLGDEQAFEELVGRYNAPLRYYVRRITEDSDSADDVVQSVWVGVLRGIRKLRTTKAFRVWIYRLARNKAFDALRQRKRLPTFVDEIDALAQGHENDEEEFSAGDAAQIHACLSRLSVKHRDVLVLRFMEGMTYDEIARATDSPGGTVRSRMHQAKLALKRELRRMAHGRE